MDINKENTKYLASLLSNCGATQDEINDLSFDDEVGFFESNRLADWFVSQINFGWRVWQAAKAHEAEKLKGCVLVPVQCPDPDFADSLFDELSKKAIGEFGDDLLIHFSDIDEEKIWALMVEAAKAQAVHEGFVLVEKTKLMQIVGSAAIIEPITRGNPLMSKYKTELDFILSTVRAMIEAQEPAND